MYDVTLADKLNAYTFLFVQLIRYVISSAFERILLIIAQLLLNIHYYYTINYVFVL